MFSAKEKKVYIKTKADKLLDAMTGKPIEGAPPTISMRSGSITGCAALSTQPSVASP